MSEVLQDYMKVYKAMWQEEAREEGIVVGKAEGIVEGKAEERVEFAFNLFKEGLTDFSKVSRLVGIDLDTVEELYKEYMSMA